MSAKIEMLGIEATVSNGQWRCDDAGTLDLLTAQADYFGDSPSIPDIDEALAREAEKCGATITKHSDRPIPEADPGWLDGNGFKWPGIASDVKRFGSETQPRVPAGSPEGGEFASKYDASGSSSLASKVSALKAAYPAAPMPRELAFGRANDSSPEAVAFSKGEVAKTVERAVNNLSRQSVAYLPDAYPTLDSKSDAMNLASEAGALRGKADTIAIGLERETPTLGFANAAAEVERGQHGEAVTHARDLIANAREVADKQTGRAAQALADKVPDDNPIVEPEGRNAIGNALIFHPEDFPEAARAGIMALADKGVRYDCNVSGCIILKDENKSPAGKAIREVTDAVAYRPVRLSGESTNRTGKEQTARDKQVGRLWDKSTADVHEAAGKQYKRISEKVALQKSGDRYQVIDASKVPT